MASKNSCKHMNKGATSVRSISSEIPTHFHCQPSGKSVVSSKVPTCFRRQPSGISCTFVRKSHRLFGYRYLAPKKNMTNT